MSHAKERQEKNCLNCGAAIYGKFCHVCGQENIETKESFIGLLTHFIYDITHFDGKFFNTLKYLLFKPGFLSKEYLLGRRQSYLHPIKMYVFTSAFFFLIFFSFYQKKGNTKEFDFKVNGKTKTQIASLSDADFALFTAAINKNNKKDSVPMTRKEFDLYVDTLITNTNPINIFGKEYKDKAQYDSLTKAGKVSANWIEKKVIEKNFELKEKYKGNSKGFSNDFKQIFLHLFPQMLFVSLPFFALLLWLLYFRQRGKFYYVHHAIFTIHFYCATFIVILLGLWINSIAHLIHFTFLYKIGVVFGIVGAFYLYKALRNFYGSSRVKTIIKYLLLLIIFLIVLIIIFVGFLVFSIFSL